MITEIGIVAGEIWHALDEHGPQPLDVLLGRLERHRELVLMSLGWLAREGHVVMTGGPGALKAALRSTT